jgi:hypothetical protein
LDSTLGSQSATFGNSSTIIRPIACRQMKGSSEARMVFRLISGGATDLR